MMNKKMLKSAIDDIKASDELKQRFLNSMITKSKPRTNAKQYYRRLMAGFASLVIVASVLVVCLNYNSFPPLEGPTSFNDYIKPQGGIGGDLCEMFLSNGDMYYTDHENNLYRYISADKADELVATLEIRPSSKVFEDNGFIYYSDGSTVFQRDIAKNTSVPLVLGNNIGVDGVSNGILLYTIAYQNDTGNFTEFEYHMYETANGKDTLLFERSDAIWQILDFNNKVVVADSSHRDNAGLFTINLPDKVPYKLLDLRVHEGKILNGKFYYTSHDEKGLWYISLDGNGKEQISLPDGNDPDAFVDRITGSGNNLFVAVYFNGENHLIQINLQTYQTKILAEGLGRVWKLCTDGTALYAYDTKSPYDKHGNITVIPLS